MDEKQKQNELSPYDQIRDCDCGLHQEDGADFKLSYNDLTPQVQCRSCGKKWYFFAIFRVMDEIDPARIL